MRNHDNIKAGYKVKVDKLQNGEWEHMGIFSIKKVTKNLVVVNQDGVDVKFDRVFKTENGRRAIDGIVYFEAV